MGLEYKFVELSIVTDESIEEAVNTWVARGWLLEGIRFVTTEASRRPQMAFVSFTREAPHAVQHEKAPLTLAPEPHDASDAGDAIDQTAPRPKGPRLVKADPDDEPD
jgi:hypothetical protein